MHFQDVLKWKILFNLSINYENISVEINTLFITFTEVSTAQSYCRENKDIIQNSVSE